MKVQSCMAAGWLRISIEGTTHLCFRPETVVGLHTWRTGNLSWSLEITTAKGVITSEYDKRDQLEAILTEIERVL